MKHCHIEFSDEPPVQLWTPYQRILDKKQEQVIDQEIEKLLEIGVLNEVEMDENLFISPIFTVPKKGTDEHRMILNLKELNQYIEPHHFKMETFESTLKLIKPGSFLASIDLRHAYYSVNIAEKDRKYLCFQWKAKIFQYTCLPNGITSAPRIFTKLMKPVFSTLRKFGHKNSAYIDDSLLIGDSFDECSKNVQDTVFLLKHLGFFVHDKKSVFVPTQKITYLGNIIDTFSMTVYLPQEKVKRIKEECWSLMIKKIVSIRVLAKVIGILVSSFSAVEYGPLHYRVLEKRKIEALKDKHGNFDSNINLNSAMKYELEWWYKNIETQSRVINHGNPNFSITTDASLDGWGAIKNEEYINGRWNDIEKTYHINYLELLAIFYGIKSFCKNITNVHVQLLSDNSSSVAHINNMGGIKSELMNDLTKSIWSWCSDRNIWISAAHIPGKSNPADIASRKFNDNVEWMLDKLVFQKLVKLWGTPSVDLFASRLNCQVPRFGSWKPDPDAEIIDAFSISWSDGYFYMFPPFSLVNRCIQKIIADKSETLMILPFWPTQIWFSLVMELLVQKPVLLPRRRKLLTLPQSDRIHPLHGQLRLIACRLSGQTMKVREFQEKQPESFLHLGEEVQRNNMHIMLRNGFVSVTKGRLIHFIQL